MRISQFIIFAFVFFWYAVALEPGIYSSHDREEKIQQWKEEKASRYNPTLFHSLHSLGEMYMTTIEKLNANIMYFFSYSFDNILTEKQWKFHMSSNGLDQGNSEEFIDPTSIFNSNSEYLSRPEHRSTRFVQKTNRSLENDWMKGESNFVEFQLMKNDHPIRLDYSPKQKLPLDKVIALPKSMYQQNQNKGTHRQLIETFIPRVLADPPYIPADGIVRFSSTESCQHGSKLILIQQTTYYCNGEIVGESWFKGLSDQQRTKSNCFSKLLKHEACLCSVDLIGKFCQFETRIQCSLVVINKPTCPYLNEDAYVSAYSGIPPCVSITSQTVLSYQVNGQSLTISFLSIKESFLNQVKAECRNWMDIRKDPTVYETNSDMVMLLDDQPPSAALPWTKFTGYSYVIDTGNLKVTRERYITPQVQYINWEVMGKTVKDNYGDKFYLSHAQLQGTQTFSIILNFRSLNTNMTTAGRYSVEFNVAETIINSKNEKQWLGSSHVISFTLEDESYNEPINSYSSLSKGLLTLIILGPILLILVVVIQVRKYKERKSRIIEEEEEQERTDEDSFNIQSSINLNLSLIQPVLPSRQVLW